MNFKTLADIVNTNQGQKIINFRGLRVLGFCFRTYVWFRTYADITLSLISPTDLTMNPSAQNVAPQYTSSKSGNCSLIFLLIPPLIRFIIALGLHFGPAPMYKCTWSGSTASSKISQPWIWQANLIIPSMRFTISPDNTLFLYLGMNTKWYLRSYLVCAVDFNPFTLEVYYLLTYSFQLLCSRGLKTLG